MALESVKVEKTRTVVKICCQYLPAIRRVAAADTNSEIYVWGTVITTLKDSQKWKVYSNRKILWADCGNICGYMYFQYLQILMIYFTPSFHASCVEDLAVTSTLLWWPDPGTAILAVWSYVMWTSFCDITCTPFLRAWFTPQAWQDILFGSSSPGW